MHKCVHLNIHIWIPYVDSNIGRGRQRAILLKILR